MGTAALDQMVMLTTYIPTIFGLICLGTAFEDGVEIQDFQKVKNGSGAVGGITGFMCLCYSIAFCHVIGARSPDLCKILMMARLCLALLFVIGGGLLLYRAESIKHRQGNHEWGVYDDRGQWDVVRAVMFFSFGFFALPESCLLFTYGSALQREHDGPMQAQTELRNFQNVGQPMSQQGPPGYPQQAAPGYNGGGFEGQRVDPYANMMCATRS